MAKLPFSRVVNVTLTRNENFASLRGFGVPIFLTNDSLGVGILDATTRTRVYGSMDEVAAEWTSDKGFYKAAEVAFSQTPRPLQVKVGYLANPAVGGVVMTSALFKTNMDAIAAFDSDWYWIGIDAPYRDKAALDGLAEWVEAQSKQAIIDTNDILTESAADTTSFAARNKNLFVRTSAFYHTDATEFPAFAFMAILGTRNFDNPETAYTGKFKKIRGIAAINKGSAAVQAITGFTPALGQSTTAGHMANTLVDIGGQVFVVEGSTLTPNVFIDEIHATDWIIARTEEQTLGVLLNNARVPFTNSGMELLASGARTVMRVADRAGLIANDDKDDLGNYRPAVQFEIPDVFSVPESQRKARIAPPIKVTFRYAGAVHYTTINYNMTF
ncbi:putative structural protein [Rhizobium phage RHph_Y55]|nr:putative structural protein [Rhizobium phage RHph_Y55]